MDILVRWIEAVAFVAGLASLVLVVVRQSLQTPAHRDAWHRNHSGDSWR